MNHQALSSFIWSGAVLLRGDYKQSDYGTVILFFHRAAAPRLRAGADQGGARGVRRQAKLNPDPFHLRTSGQGFYNSSPLERTYQNHLSFE